MEEHPIRGSAICVVEHKEFEGKDSYLLKEDRLRQLLLQAHCRDKPVAVVSIAGGARRGKSFLLSLFLRYLRAQGSEDWLENEDFPNKGFAWRMSSKGVTTGIHIWDEIFTIRLQNGEEACILLMDTEGTFDSEKSLAHSVTVFALSTLLSSVQIYNLKENINMDDLLHLQFFTGYGQLCLEESEEKPFQNFLFLVRNWMNYHEFPYGSEGGEKLLNEKLQTSGISSEEVKKVKEDIKHCFTKLTCFLMPHPGERVAGDPSFEGCLSGIKEDFKNQLRNLVPQLLSRENMILKTIAGKPITCKQLFEFFKSYVEVYNNREGMPEPKGFFEATAEVQHRNAHDEAVDHYTQEMNKRATEIPVPSQKRMDEVHASLRVEAIDKFTSSRKMGRRELSARYQSLLDKNLHELHEKYEMQRDVREERIKTELMEAATHVLKEYGEDMIEVMITVPLVTEEELQLEHEEKKNWAIQNFMKERGIASEDLFRKYEEKLEKDIDSQSTLYFTKRKWKENIADRDLLNAVQYTVWIYCTQMGRSCGGAIITEEELEENHMKYYKEALETFSQRTQITLCPYLLDGHHTRLIMRLDEVYKKYIDIRELNERQAETELMNAKEEAMEEYNGMMSKFLVDLMSEEKLNKMHANFRQQTTESFEETGEKYPHLAKKHTHDLEVRMSSEHERYKALRNSQELQAEAALQDAVERSMTLYELEMSCLCGGKGTADGGRQGPTDSHLLTVEELREGHEKYRWEALKVFWETGAQWQYLGVKYKEELEEGLMKAKEELEEKRKSKEKIVRRLLEKTVREKAEDYLSPTRMKNFYGENVVDKRELEKNHEEHRDAVVRSFMEDGDWAPSWLVEEYRAILETNLDVWHRSLEVNMAEERAKRYQEKNVFGLVGTLVPPVANSIIGPGAGGMALAAVGAAESIFPLVVWKSRWRNVAVLPDLSSIIMPLRGRAVSPSIDEGEDSGRGGEPEEQEESE